MTVKIEIPKADIESINEELVSECVETPWQAFSETFTFEGEPHRVMLDLVQDGDYAQMILYREIPSSIAGASVELIEVSFTEPEYETISDEWELCGDEDSTVTVMVVEKEEVVA